MGRTLSRGHHRATESVMYVAISFISVWSISSIFIPITYYFFLSCFIIVLSGNIRDKHAKGTNHIIVCCCLLYLIFNWMGQFLGIVVHHFERVSVIYGQCDYYGLICITHFVLINSNYLFSVFVSIFSTKNQKQGSRGTIFHTGCKHWTAEKFESQDDNWEEISFCWNSTATQVTKLICYSTHFFLAWWLVLELVLDRKLIKDLSSKSACSSLSLFNLLLTLQENF